MHQEDDQDDEIYDQLCKDVFIKTKAGVKRECEIGEKKGNNCFENVKSILS